MRIVPLSPTAQMVGIAAQPHRIQEWMNRPDDPDFDARAERATSVLADAVAPDSAPWHVVASFDEKSGMQAL